MHILIIPSWYKSVDQPVLGSFFEEQARALIKAGHQVGIIYPNFYPPNVLFRKKDALIYYTNDNGLPTYSFNIQGYVPRARTYNYRNIGIRTATVFEEYVSRFGIPDLIHAHSVFYAGIATNYLFQKYGIPYIITEHLTTFITGGVINEVDREISSRIYSEAAKAIVVSSSFKHDLSNAIRIPEEKLSVVHNMVSDLFFESFEEKKYKQGDEFVFLTNSFFNERKNIKMLFDALKMMRHKNLNVRLKVGGYGSIERDLKDYVKKINLVDRVDFIGEQTRASVKTEMDNCHVFVLPSIYETFGVVLIESLACGRPVVSTDCGGPRDIVIPENGIIINSFQPAVLAAAMERIMINYQNYNQQQISDDCRHRFSEKFIAGQLIDIYNEALQKRISNTNIDIRRISRLTTHEQRNILLTFDYELFLGRRSGSIADCIINPTNKLLKIFDPYHVKAIFFIDTTYLLKLIEYSNRYEKCAADFETIATQLKQMVRNGHYIFPHIHSHWLDAKYDEQTNEWNLLETRHYRFHSIDENQRNFIFTESVKLLESIAHKVNPKYKVEGFRAGGWSIQPFDDFINLFRQNKVRYDFSVLGKSYQFSNVQYFDFSNAPEKMIYHFNDDVCIEVPNGEFVQIANSTIEIEKWRDLANKALKKVIYRIGVESSLQRGEGLVAHEIAGRKPESSKGSKAADYLSVEMMSDAILPAMKKYLRNHQHMHFVSHPKMITDYSMKQLSEFLEYAYRNYFIETDFRIMAATD